MKTQSNPHYPEVQEADPQDVFSHKNDLTLIDVRQPDEYVGNLGHVDGAKLIVLDALPERMSEIPKDKPVVMICKSGGRSMRATAYLLNQGYDKVYNMIGGMMLWNDYGLPTSKENN
jgi:rhodanese-related sulfurtransferase